MSCTSVYHEPMPFSFVSGITQLMNLCYSGPPKQRLYGYIIENYGVLVTQFYVGKFLLHLRVIEGTYFRHGLGFGERD